MNWVIVWFLCILLHHDSKLFTVSFFLPLSSTQVITFCNQFVTWNADDASTVDASGSCSFCSTIQVTNSLLFQCTVSVLFYLLFSVVVCVICFPTYAYIVPFQLEMLFHWLLLIKKYVYLRLHFEFTCLYPGQHTSLYCVCCLYLK